jgi:hypothetical protein
MILKKKKSNLLLGGLLLFTSVIFLSANKDTLIIEFHNVYENFMTFNPGFSSARNLDVEGNLVSYDNRDEYEIQLISKGILMLKVIPALLLKKRQNSEIEPIKSIDLIIKFSNYKKILEDRSNAILTGFLTNPRTVNGIVKYQGNEYGAKIRLKGDLNDHWLSAKRMSLRITLKDDQTIFGINKFSIHKPYSRQYPYEHAFQNALRANGNLGAQHDFAKVTLNGESWGIMNVEENISKQLLEKSGLKDSLVFRFSNDDKWLKYNRQFEDSYPFFRYSDPKLIATVDQQSKYFTDLIQRKRFTYILEQRLKKNHSHLYSLEPHMKALLAALVWNNTHTLSDSNSRYYFNPYILALEPITMDQGMFSYLPNHFIGMDRGKLTEVYSQVLLSAKQNIKIDSYLEFMHKFSQNLELELNKFTHYFPMDAYKTKDVILKNIEFLEENKGMLKQWFLDFELADDETNFVRKPTDFEARAFNEHLHVRHYDDGRLMVFNLLPEAVELNQVIHKGVEIDMIPISIPGYSNNSYEPFEIKTNILGIQDNSIKIVSSYLGNIKVIDAYPTLISEDIFNPLLVSTAHNFDFIANTSDGNWKISAGEWVVDKPLVVFGDILFAEGAKLKFSDNAYLVVKGGMRVLGSPSSPVVFESIDSHWKGIYVLGSPISKSFIKNAVFKNTSGVNDGLLSLTGGINFYAGTVKMDAVLFQLSSAEDSLNIVNAEIDIANVSIINSFSDGFDCDYCKGKITNSLFDGMGGDGLDFSTSSVSLNNLSFKNIKDKALSVGEASSIKISNTSMQNIGVGIAAKDGSYASATNIAISNYALHAAMTYSKKNYYDLFSSLEISNSDINGPNPFLRQTGTSLIVDSNSIKAQDVNVDELYSTGVMKK